MARAVDLTLGRLRRSPNLDDSRFLELYARLMRRDDLSDDELVDALRFAVLFSRSEDPIVARLGYRIVLQYGEVTRDYEPLHALAESRDLTPVVLAAERLNPGLGERESFLAALYAAHRTNFITEEHDGTRIPRTRGQMELRSFNSREPEAIVVAPTSYGKSEMLVEKLARSLQSSTCVVVPSRALIAQTRASIIKDERVRSSRIRVITHPDAYVDETSFIAVMTQERLQRLLTDRPELVLDQLLVDEAHNLLPQDGRAVELSQVILVCRARNPSLSITYYTPFMTDPGSLRHVNGADQRARVKVVNEHVKAERIVHAPLGGTEELYDQFLDRTIDLGRRVATDELDAVKAIAGHRTLVYVNRPRDAQGLAARLSERLGEAELSPQARVAVAAIADLIDPNYSLIGAIRSGVLFHHGQIPDLLRQYIEELFREDDATRPRFLVTTSTLLEGVNTPADCLVLMTPSRGRGYLGRSAFRNLVGRVGRFKEVFDSSRTDLDLLQPRIYLIPSSYARDNWNVGAFLKDVANLAKNTEDRVENPLLEAAPDSEARRDALEYLDNVEHGASELLAMRRASTEVGQLCFRNGVHDFDIFENEDLIQQRIDQVADGQQLTDVRQVIDGICDIFLRGVELIGVEDLARVRDTEGARRFYTMFLDWRSRNEPFKRMISRFVRYWSQLDEERVYIGRKWGEIPYDGDGPPLWVQMRTKSRAEMINLAVVKIKEEQDFVDFRLVKYVEILNSLGLVEQGLYYRIKYGTDDPYLICLLRNGFSPELARLAKDGYPTLVRVDLDASTVSVLPDLPDTMQAAGENDILVYEARTLVNVGLDS